MEVASEVEAEIFPPESRRRLTPLSLSLSLQTGRHPSESLTPSPFFTLQVEPGGDGQRPTLAPRPA